MHNDNTNKIIAECYTMSGADVKDFCRGTCFASNVQQKYNNIYRYSNPIDQCAKTEISHANNSYYIIFYRGIGI